MAAKVTPEALSFFELAHSTFCELYDRWMDEREYEDINDYRVPLDEIAKMAGVRIMRMAAKPFGCYFVANQTIFRISINNVFYGYHHLSSDEGIRRHHFG